MAPKSNQVTLDFDKMRPQDLKPLTKKFEKHGYKIVNVESNNRIKRESGFAIKTAIFTFEDGQKMDLRVKGDGTIFQVKLNNKVMPIKHVDDMDKAVVEMCDFVYDNAKAYERAKKAREKRKLIPPKPSITTSRAQKIAAAKETLGKLSQSNADLEKQALEIEMGLTGNRGKLEETRKALNAEKKRTEELEAAIAKLEKAGYAANVA